MTDKQRISKRTAVVKAIRAAFKEVTLGQGISLRQANVSDLYAESLTLSEFKALPQGEVTDDWSRIPLAELEIDSIANLDAEGFRYYIPALMLRLLEHYDNSMRVISTLSSLYPKKDSWEYDMSRYSLLTADQKSAIAFFLSSLLELADLDYEDKPVVTRALNNYWAQFLTNSFI